MTSCSALGGCFGPGCKISFGRDLAGDLYTGTDDGILPTPDSDPFDCLGHGTGMMGVIAASNSSGEAVCLSPLSRSKEPP